MHQLIFRRLEGAEQKAILPLLGGCFPDYWEQVAAAGGKMPFQEISFAAFDGGEAVGHCGVIPYEIWCGGRIEPMAGIASVATAPTHRKMGIAGKLCEMAVQWAANGGFRALPLYTGLFHVYERSGWRVLAVPPAREFPLPRKAASRRWRPGGEVTGAEREEIMKLYGETERFDGKVLRARSGTLHSWERIFAEPEFKFAVDDGAYAIETSGVVVETGFSGGMSRAGRWDFFSSLGRDGKVVAYLPPTADNLRILSERENSASPEDVMHGERPMVLDLHEGFHRDDRSVFFPAADKF